MGVFQVMTNSPAVSLESARPVTSSEAGGGGGSVVGSAVGVGGADVMAVAVCDWALSPSGLRAWTA